MRRVIDFEAHYYTPELMNLFSRRSSYPCYSVGERILRFSDDFAASNPKKLAGLLKSVDERISDMDAAGTDMQVLSVSAGIEMLGKEEAVEQAHRANNTVFQWMREYPGRFSGYAALPVQDIGESVREMERCKYELGFFGWNTFSSFGSTALDDDVYLPLLAKAEELGMPIYLHPAVTSISRLLGLGPQLTGGGAGFAYDTAITLLRLIFKGVFDQFPELKVIVGHLGEGLAFTFDRLDSRSKRTNIAPAKNKASVGYYFKKNIRVTCSGVFSHEAFRCAKDVWGVEAILFGSDYPYEQPEEVKEFLAGLPLSERERDRIFFKNAKDFFGF